MISLRDHRLKEAHEILTQMAILEKTVGMLYLNYSKLWPEFRNFWVKISEEEFKHAEMILTLKNLLDLHEIKYTGELNPEVIQKTIQIVKQEMKNANLLSIKAKDALAVALSIEESLLEQSYFNLFSGDTKHFIDLKEVIMEDTRRHRDTMQDKYQQQ